MDQGVKLAAACGVVIVGIVAALLFRRESPSPQQPGPETGQRVAHRKHVPPPLSNGPASRWSGIGRDESVATLPAPHVVAQDAGIRTPMDAVGTPPDLARDYPRGDPSTTSRWGASISLNPPNAATPTALPQTHTIVDGDTLDGLAEQYLGSADRYAEIYEANRDVLPSPQLLPIGVELKIPPRNNPRSKSAAGLLKRPMVPVVGTQE